jgi:extradiol dioxygenase family protein
LNPALDPFHLAIPVDDIEAARVFYGSVLGCAEGRSAPTWVDFNLFGHQLVVHLHSGAARRAGHSNEVDGHDVPVPHFGVVLDWTRWQALSARLTAHGVKFGIEPHVRFAGQVGEQATMFLRDPAGNALEFKAFKDPDALFAK